MAISVSGVGSGLDIESLVSQLMAAEAQAPNLRLAKREASYQADLSAVGSLKSALSTLQSAVKNLQEPEGFLVRTAESSDTKRFTALTQGVESVPGRYQIEIEQLAQPARVSTIGFAGENTEIGTGSLTIGLGAETFELTVDSSNQTLAGLRDAINAAEANPGITASIINVDNGTQLVLSAEKTGAANNITIVATDNDTSDNNDLARLNTENLVILQAAQDAKLLLDEQQVTRDTNSFSDVIAGVSFSLKQAEVGVKETLTVSFEKAAVSRRVGNFVEAYNGLAETIKQLGGYDEATKQGGQLQGDASLIAIENRIRQAIFAPVVGASAATLAEIGVKTGSDGQLAIDQAKLSQIIDQDFSAVSKLFSGDGGLAKRFNDLIERFVSNDGILDSRTQGLERQLAEVSDDRAQLQDRLAVIEKRYRSQFTALDGLVSQLQSVGNFLTQQLANLPKPRVSSGK